MLCFSMKAFSQEYARCDSSFLRQRSLLQSHFRKDLNFSLLQIPWLYSLVQKSQGKGVGSCRVTGRQWRFLASWICLCDMAEIVHSVPTLAACCLSSLPWLNNYDVHQGVCSVHNLYSLGSYQQVFKHGALEPCFYTEKYVHRKSCVPTNWFLRYLNIELAHPSRGLGSPHIPLQRRLEFVLFAVRKETTMSVPTVSLYFPSEAAITWEEL